jgi:hypothetical protein
MLNLVSSFLVSSNLYKVGLFDDILPDFFGRTKEVGDEVSDADFIIGLIRNGLILLFVAVILIAIVFSAMAGIKFITSRGEAEEVSKAQAALKNVLVGVAAVFIAIIAIFLISAIFSDTSQISVKDSLRCFLGDTSFCKT